MRFEAGYSTRLKRFVIRCDYCKTVVTQLRYLKGSEWDAEKKQWTCFPILENAIRIESISIVARRNHMYATLRDSYHDKTYELETAPEEMPIAKKKKTLKNKRPTMPRLPFPKHLSKVMMDFQKDGVRFIERRNGRALIGDDMGLGKTLQVLAFLLMHKIDRTVVVCTSTLKFNWEEECVKWKVKGATVISGWPNKSNTWEKFLNSRIVVINYDILEKWKPYLIRWAPDAIVFDECHYIKNHKAQRTKAAKAIAKKCKYVIGMSGTPVENAPGELYNIFNIIRPGMFDWYHYIFRYCTSKNGGKVEANNTQELHEILTKTIMIRRTKAEVLKELPPKRRVVVNVDIDLHEYRKMCKQFMEEGSEDPSSMIEHLTELRSYVAEQKIKPTIEWIDNFLLSGKKLIVFAHHRKTVRAIVDHYPNSVHIYGGTKGSDRQKAVRAFQTDPRTRLFVGGITACAEGINLTAASDVLMAEMIYNPKKMEQGEDRSCRKGQTLPVSVYYLVVNGTYEQTMLNILEAKRDIVGQITDGTSNDKSANIRSELIKYILRQ